MGSVIFSINMTLDGCVDHTKSNSDEEVHDYFTNLLKGVDLVFYGRKTYELMVPFWPDIAKNHSGGTKSMNDFATTFDAIDKIVVSRSLTHVDDPRTRIVRANPAEELQKLKQEPGKKIALGGVDLASQLIAQDLVDEYYFVIQPIIVGEGRRLLDITHLQQRLQLKLVASKVLSSGTVALHFTK
ncbi:dihydrofolate reductase family protein [Chitinophaga pinensis]|uniref:Dihydrofolate reductase n=1 Tax=Chitinophaga pinensis TaxID=79329 RepID=A0A5C6LKU7_9BACT|nr:dihydrofolate reductase family protein [Chitinophaga pinensis]TWV89106.1 dihydrofolate reductase [Chitinophaga pinensis]